MAEGKPQALLQVTVDLCLSDSSGAQWAKCFHKVVTLSSVTDKAFQGCAPNPLSPQFLRLVIFRNTSFLLLEKKASLAYLFKHPPRHEQRETPQRKWRPN